MLLLKRSPNEANYANHWALPGGGGEAGEEPHETALREAREETGYEGNTHAMSPVSVRRTPRGTTYHTFLHHVDEMFEPSLNSEHVEYSWADPDNMPEPIHPSVLKTINALPAQDMAPEDWDAMRAGVRKFMHEEEGEAEHDPAQIQRLAENIDKFLGEEEEEPQHQVQDDSGEGPWTVVSPNGSRSAPIPVYSQAIAKAKQTKGAWVENDEGEVDWEDRRGGKDEGPAPVYLQRQLWSGHDNAEPSALLSAAQRDGIAKRVEKPLNIKGAPGTRAHDEESHDDKFQWDEGDLEIDGVVFFYPGDDSEDNGGRVERERTPEK